MDCENYHKTNPPDPPDINSGSKDDMDFNISFSGESVPSYNSQEYSQNPQNEQSENNRIKQGPLKKLFDAFANKTNSNSNNNTNETNKNAINTKENRYDINTRYQYTDKYPFCVLIESNEGNIGRLHAIKVGHFLKENPNINKFIEKISPLGRNKIKVSLTNFKAANELITDNCIKNNNLIAYIPKLYVEKRGIVKGIDTFFSEEYILNEVKAEHSNVISVNRKFRKIKDQNNQEKLVPRQLITLSFQGNSLPKLIHINKVEFEVEPYVFPVIQCLGCLRFGHVQQNCKGKKRCITCGETHDENVTCFMKCIFCKSEQHDSRSKECEEYKIQKSIKETMARCNLTFLEAKKVYNNPSFANILTQNRYQALNNLSEYPPLNPNSQSNNNRTFFQKPKIQPNQSFKQTDGSSCESTKKRKAENPTEEIVKRKSSISNNSSILPNPYREEFIAQKNTIINSVAEYTNDLISSILNSNSLINLNELETKIKHNLSTIINNFSDLT